MTPAHAVSLWYETYINLTESVCGWGHPQMQRHTFPDRALVALAADARRRETLLAQQLVIQRRRRRQRLHYKVVLEWNTWWIQFITAVLWLGELRRNDILQSGGWWFLRRRGQCRQWQPLDCRWIHYKTTGVFLNPFDSKEKLLLTWTYGTPFQYNPRNASVY